MKKILVLALVIMFLVILLVACGGGGSWQTADWSEDVEMENVEFKGVSATSVPMAVSNLRILQRERPSSGSRDTTDFTYTIIGTLQKTSTNVEESFFTFDVTLIDEFGRHIKSENVSTMPWRTTEPLFKHGSTKHLELEMLVLPFHSDKQAVAVEFNNINEVDKDGFIHILLDMAIERIERENDNDIYWRADLEQAENYLKLVLHHDPDNIEANELLERLATQREQRNNEDEEEHDISVADDPIDEIEPTPSPEPSATPESSPTPTPSPTPTLEPDDYILTIENNEDFATLLSTYFPSQEEIEEFVEKYTGRTVEFDGHIFMSSRQFHGMRETPPTSLHVFLWNGDSEDAIEKGYHYGCAYFMNRVRRIDFPLIAVEDTNVRVVATIEGVGYVYLDDRVTVIETYIILVPISIDAR